jgi:cell division protein FtsA
VDGETEVQQPVGMSAYRLEVDAHIVTGSSTAVNNLVQCVLAHGIDVDELVLEPLAANEAVLKPEERRMGVAVVDMGGGTSDLAIFIDNALCHTIIWTWAAIISPTTWPWRCAARSRRRKI